MRQVSSSNGSERRRLLALVLVTTAMRVAVAGTIGLSVDESYAVVMSRHLSLSYFDHPPMLFWWTALATRLFGSEQAAVVRLPFIVAFMGTTWLLYRLGRFLFGTEAGLLAAVLLNLSLFFSIAAGGWALPDGPLLLFSAAAALCLARATIGAPRNRAWWTGFGASVGLALLSKYHALLLLAGAGVYLVTTRERARWLRRPEPYLALLVAAVFSLPVVVWNASHAWVSFRFQAGRALLPNETASTPLLDSLAGQLAWVLPWILVPLLWALLGALRGGPGDSPRWLLACLASGPIFGFTIVAAAGARGLPHWEAPGYFMVFPLLGALAAPDGRVGRWVSRWLWACGLGMAFVVLALVTHTRTGWITTAAPEALSRGDPTDDLLDWAPVARRLRALGFPRADTLIATARWDDAAKLSYAMGPAIEVACVGSDPRGFGIARNPSENIGRDVLLAVRRRSGPEPLTAYASYFRSLHALDSESIDRGGRRELTVSLYLGQGLKRALPPLQ